MIAEALVPLLSFIALEVILRIDNIIFIPSNKLPERERKKFHYLGIGPGLHFEIPKAYIYFSMAFAFLVHIIQIKTHNPKIINF
jgi:predicted tellurium resistance membrane protein TerC